MRKYSAILFLVLTFACSVFAMAEEEVCYDDPIPFIKAQAEDCLPLKAFTDDSIDYNLISDKLKAFTKTASDLQIDISYDLCPLIPPGTDGLESGLQLCGTQNKIEIRCNPAWSGSNIRRCLTVRNPRDHASVIVSGDMCRYFGWVDAQKLFTMEQFLAWIRQKTAECMNPNIHKTIADRKACMQYLELLVHEDKHAVRICGNRTGRSCEDESEGYDAQARWLYQQYQDCKRKYTSNDAKAFCEALYSDYKQAIMNKNFHLCRCTKNCTTCNSECVTACRASKPFPIDQCPAACNAQFQEYCRGGVSRE